MTVTHQALTDQQIADYRGNGFLVVRNVLSCGEADELRRTVQHQAQSNAYPPKLTYPESGKYTISGNRMAGPGMASIAEHPAVVDAAECLLGQPAYLTAYVAYVRTPARASISCSMSGPGDSWRLRSASMARGEPAAFKGPA